MKKASGFEKFFKGKEKTGGAKKEAIRKEKRQVRKEREDEIAAHKRQKRAQAREGFSSQQPQRRNQQDVLAFSQRDGERRGKAPFKANNKRAFSTKQGSSEAGKNTGFQKRKEDGRKRPSFTIEKKSGGAERPYKRFDKPSGYRDQPSGFKKEGGKPFEKKEKTAQKRPQKFSVERRPQRTNGAKPQATGGNAQRAAGNSQLPTGNRQPATPTAQTEAMPLNKYIAHSGLCSRRDAVDFIKGGKVKVNGELVLEPGHKVAMNDEVKVAGKRLNPVRDFVYILLNKPKDYITTTDDPQQRKTVLDLLKAAPPARIYPVGRLDRNTSGVLLLTNDGELSQRLTHPSNEVKKIYAVTLDKPLTKHHFDELLKGVQLEDGPATVDVLAYTDAKDHSQLGVELHSGRNRIVRRLFEHLGYDVKALDRVMFAGLTKKNVNRGRWRFLTEREVRDLKFFKKGRG